MASSDINRSVHLALRDKNYLKFTALLKRQFSRRSLTSRRKLVLELLQKVETAALEAVDALRGIKEEPLERDFLSFLRMLDDGCEAIRFMVEFEEILEHEGGFLKRMISRSPARLVKAQLTHRQSALEIYNELRAVVRMADSRFEDLRKKNIEALGAEGRRRYQAMFNSAE